MEVNGILFVLLTAFENSLKKKKFIKDLSATSLFRHNVPLTLDNPSVLYLVWPCEGWFKASSVNMTALDVAIYSKVPYMVLFWHQDL